MDVVQAFNDELQSLVEVRPPVSKAKMGLITRAAMKGVKFYKHVVQSVEKFIAKCRPEYKVPGLYVIDSIVRQSRHQFGQERDVFASRFARNFQTTFINLFAGCFPDDKPKIVRVLNLWQKNGVFTSQIIQPLLDMANPNSSLSSQSDMLPSANSPPISEQQQSQTSKYFMHNTFNGSTQFSKNHEPSAKHSRDLDGGLRFSKNMLDFDYDEDDDDENDGDETPTEAEPPLSSTLNKIEMEERGKNNSPALGHSSSHLLTQPVSNQQSNFTTRTDQDPVLERWNRLIRQHSVTTHDNSGCEDARPVRLRSRSPAARDNTIKSRELLPQSKTESSPRNQEEKDSAKQLERARKCLPKIRDKHLTVCSSTLWLGHVPKTVSEADISDAFGEFGSITSINLIPPRGCAYVCMDRRQDAKRALSKSKDLKLNGSHIKMAWAPGKGFKEYKRLKEFWEVDTGSSYIPYNKIDSSIDFDVLEEGGVIDEDSMSMEMRETRERKAREKNTPKPIQPTLNLPIPTLPILAQPPPFTIPPPNLAIPPPVALGQGPMIGIPFPPPSVAASNQMPPPSQSMFDNQELLERDNNNETFQSPNSLDKQLSITERQINMVEQQLNLIQQAQNMNQPPQMSALGPPMFHPAHANPMLFDIHPQSLLHPGQPLLDPNHQMTMFASPPTSMAQPVPMLPINQQGMNPKINVNHMPHYNGRY